MLARNSFFQKSWQTEKVVDRAGFEPAASAFFCRACEGGVHARLNYRPQYRLNQRQYLTVLKSGFLMGEKKSLFLLGL
jgi:hypothetical protein